MANISFKTENLSSIASKCLDLLKIVNSRSKIKLIENPLFRKDFEVERRFGSNQKLQSLIGSKPQTTLDEGLEKTYKYILENK